MNCRTLAVLLQLGLKKRLIFTMERNNKHANHSELGVFMWCDEGQVGYFHSIKNKWMGNLLNILVMFSHSYST